MRSSGARHYPEGAITMARTLLESTLKTILDDRGIAYQGSGDPLPALYKAVSGALGLAPGTYSEQAFKQILGGCHSVVVGLGSLRNKAGDAHGSGRRNLPPGRAPCGPGSQSRGLHGSVPDRDARSPGLDPGPPFDRRADRYGQPRYGLALDMGRRVLRATATATTPRTYSGRHVGRFDGDGDLPGGDGLYLGDVIAGDRLITHQSKKSWRRPPFTPWAATAPSRPLRGLRDVRRLRRLPTLRQLHVADAGAAPDRPLPSYRGPVPEARDASVSKVRRERARSGVRPTHPMRSSCTRPRRAESCSGRGTSRTKPSPPPSP